MMSQHVAYFTYPLIQILAYCVPLFSSFRPITHSFDDLTLNNVLNIDKEFFIWYTMWYSFLKISFGLWNIHCIFIIVQYHIHVCLYLQVSSIHKGFGSIVVNT